MGIYIGLGDLHGQVGTLDRLKTVQSQYPTAVTVFMGDYIDSFGDNHGFELLEKIHDMQVTDPTHTIVLMGNHEQAALSFFYDSDNAWLSFGGDSTLEAVTDNFDIEQARLSVLDNHFDLLDWMEQMPMTYTAGKLCFVHAGLDMNLDDPIRDTSDYDRLWSRASYWYDPHEWGTFDKNKLNFSIITGHTANGKIMGRYFNEEKPDKEESDRSPIYAIQYPGEMPRYLMDGGVGEGDPKLLGNIGVFDSETGLLIDALED
ncbi:metallophosphoesterase [Companilactobacillus nodensis]|uniref:Diadenosine tetraphosphatase related serine threonine protein phosphatase n=1 Tax=Companilactobacillus nodensis DSM 19682 = JCM 14932 = NBRC 107160 TaxID=1423775 RepID=A0A0R1KLQ9_9LACO|nr:metallophosphoesterase [Companilactobacillus nodensis]KRK80151.1 Diadenosine tetraphosphatase related serine threonine protein phosphatase [Companilactobacillus nodensis DSM 19682 = JCM 14932 = NBRC 107160]